jgi:phenylpropionate dioxygenase-like ring-hydroxylating dioxygenase large terminal subunit
MNDFTRPEPALPPHRKVRADFVPQEDNTSPAIAQLERERLWPRVWQMACREEEIAQVGNFVTYEILDQSIIVIRVSETAIKAYHNVCPHRGRQLMQGCGSANKLHCAFHGWQWTLQGELLRVQDREDWNGCSDMADRDLRLSEVRLGRWGGFVFINLDADGEAFDDFIAPVHRALDPLGFEEYRFGWYKTLLLKANWKTAIEAFQESYHVASVHPQYLPVVDELNKSYAEGQHSKHVYLFQRPMGAPSHHTTLPVPADLRAGVAGVLAAFRDWVGDAEGKGQVTARSAAAAQRVLTEVPEGTPPQEVMMAAVGFMLEAAHAQGVQWPRLTPEQTMAAGVDWTVFPNMGLVFAFDGCLVFRARPNGSDPDSCIFDAWSILRLAPQEVPRLQREFYPDWKAREHEIPGLLVQDLRNMEFVQRGLHSLGLKGLRTNPVQEVQVSHLHRVLHRYLYGDDELRA